MLPFRTAAIASWYRASFSAANAGFLRTAMGQGKGGLGDWKFLLFQWSRIAPVLVTPDHLEALVDTFNSWFESADGQNPKTTFFIVTAQPPPLFKPTLVLIIF